VLFLLCKIRRNYGAFSSQDKTYLMARKLRQNSNFLSVTFRPSHRYIFASSNYIQKCSKTWNLLGFPGPQSCPNLSHNFIALCTINSHFDLDCAGQIRQFFEINLGVLILQQRNINKVLYLSFIRSEIVSIVIQHHCRLLSKNNTKN
jgi:hypothetical protein